MKKHQQHFRLRNYPFVLYHQNIQAYNENTPIKSLPSQHQNAGDGQSPPWDKVPIPHIETIIQRTVQEKEKKEIVQKESHF